MDTNFIDDNIFINNAKEKKTVFILAVDTSLSVKNKIDVINEAIKNSIKEIKELDHGHNIAKVMVSILEFNSEAIWKPEKPQEIQNFNFIDLKCSNTAQSKYSLIYEQSNEILTTKEFLKEAKDYYPIILLISDGKPTDSYEESLVQCEKNEFFKKAMRVAIPIITDTNMTDEQYRESVDYEFMMDFTGQREERIFSVAHLNDLIDMLEIVTQTAVRGENKKRKQALEFDLDDPFNDIRNQIYHIK